LKELISDIRTYTINLDILKVLGNLILAAMVLILLSRVTAYTAGEEPITPVSVVSSESMEPTMDVGDIVMWTPTSIDTIRNDDIVVFRSRGGDIVSHRVVDIEEQDGDVELITQGDANDRPDPNPVTSDDLLGRVISIGDTPFRIPRLGLIWISMSDLVMGSLASMGSGGILMMVPLITAGLMMLGTILLLPEKDDDEEGKLKRLILGEEADKVHPWKVFLVLLIAFSLVVMVPSMYQSEDRSISVGVGQEAEPADEEFSRVIPGQTIHGNHSMTNYGVMRTSVYTHVDSNRDWIELEEGYKMVDSGGSARVGFRIDVPEDTEDGNYVFQMNNRYSPFWTLYPDGFVLDVMERDPARGALMLDLLTVTIFSSLSMGVMVVASLVYDEIYLWMNYRRVKKDLSKGKTDLSTRIKEKFRRYTDWLRGVDVIEFELYPCLKASSISLFAIPIALFRPDLWILILMVPLSSLLAYLYGCRWRAEIYTASMIAAGVTIGSIYIIPGLLDFRSAAGLSTIFIGAAVALVVLVLLSPLILALSYVTSKVIHRYFKQKREAPCMTDI